MQIPTETLVMDLLKPEDQNVDKAIGISALQFEPSIGTRFMCGLENGMVDPPDESYVFEPYYSEITPRFYRLSEK